MIEYYDDLDLNIISPVCRQTREVDGGSAEQAEYSVGGGVPRGCRGLHPRPSLGSEQ